METTCSQACSFMSKCRCGELLCSHKVRIHLEQGHSIDPLPNEVTDLNQVLAETSRQKGTVLKLRESLISGVENLSAHQLSRLRDLEERLVKFFLDSRPTEADCDKFNQELNSLKSSLKSQVAEFKQSIEDIDLGEESVPAQKGSLGPQNNSVPEAVPPCISASSSSSIGPASRKNSFPEAELIQQGGLESGPASRKNSFPQDELIQQGGLESGPASRKNSFPEAEPTKPNILYSPSSSFGSDENPSCAQLTQQNTIELLRTQTEYDVVQEPSASSVPSGIQTIHSPFNQEDVQEDMPVIVSSAKDNTVRVWENARPTVIIQEFSSKIKSMCMFKNHSAITGNYDGSIKVWDILSGNLLRTFGSHDGPVLCLTMPKSDVVMASGGQDGTVRLWEADSGEQCMVLRGHTDSVSAVLLSNKEDFVVSGSKDGTIRFWVEKEAVLQGHTSTVCSLALASKEKFLVSASEDETVRLWNYRTEEQIHVFRGHAGPVLSVDIPEKFGSFIVSGGKDGRIKIWSTETKSQVGVEMTHTAAVNSVRISKKRNFLVSGDEDGKIKVWKLATGERVAALERHYNSVHSIRLIDPPNSLKID